LSSVPLPRRLAAEFFVTFVFVLIGAGSAVGSASLSGPNSGTLLLVSALANGLGLAVAVTATLKISGGALNLAVAMGLWVVKKLTPKEAILHIFIKIIGATAAGVALVASFPSVLGDSVKWGSPTLGAGSASGRESRLRLCLLSFLSSSFSGRQSTLGLLTSGASESALQSSATSWSPATSGGQR